MPNNIPETEYEVQMGTNGVFRKKSRQGPLSANEKLRLIYTTGDTDLFEPRDEAAFISGMTAKRRREVEKSQTERPSKVQTYDSWQ